MMDPFSAIGFASNVLTFIDYGWKLFTETRAIYDSSATADDLTVEAITKHLTQLSSAITQSPVYGQELQEIAQTCQQVADDLHAVLQKLKLPLRFSLILSRKRKKFESFLLAVRKVWSKSEVEAFTGRLFKLQLSLLVRINWMLLNESSDVRRGIARLEKVNQLMLVQNDGNLTSLRNEAAQYVKHLQNDRLLDEFGKMQELMAQSKQFIYETAQETSSLMRSLSARLSELEQCTKNAQKHSAFLKSLYYDAIQYRHDNIDEAHAKTFGWVLSSKSSTFVEWLRNDGNLFWIQGKAGSGKSTLVKFLYQSREMRRHLCSWAGTKQLVVAKYFFWNSGTTLQKSQEGLLRSLLFEILRACPELIDLVYLDRHENDGLGTTVDSWTRRELMRTFEKLAGARLSTRFFFLIDGLDEYKGDTLELVETVYKLASLPEVKVCTSSRPWTQFVNAFGDDEKSVIKLEDLTKGDIQSYVFDRLQSNKYFQELTSDVSAYKAIANEVVARAQGVFLWVVLVVRSLLEGATYADSFTDMYARLEAFPKDLDAYFRHIIDDIPAIYRRRTALTLRIALDADRPLPLSTYYFVDELTADPWFALKLDRIGGTSFEFNRIRRRMTARLDGRCKGLLEVVPNNLLDGPLRSRQVEFMHRTVKDFLLSIGTESVTLEALPEDFDSYSILCHAFLAETKFTNSNPIKPARDFARYAALVKEEDIEAKKIDLAIYDIEKEYNDDPGLRGRGAGFVQLAHESGLLWYVRREQTENSNQPVSTSLRNVIYMLGNREAVEAGRLPATIRCLLESARKQDADSICEVVTEFSTKWVSEHEHSAPLGQQIREIEELFERLGYTPNDHSGSGKLQSSGSRVR
ncbi:hypothetical protein F5Y08DRAFT_79679 [Xylaria arbuscula]|nr:hypothetical protein F5Y08DRAFT_79679 [Xylaria arbuscula]